ncbi:MAG: hypothetical protein QNJ47_09725 [Nostocaceae cyanobacterium]|nr:hypothetical protein [Nostocaceae cyanobacterium]
MITIGINKEINYLQIMCLSSVNQCLQQVNANNKINTNIGHQKLGFFMASSTPLTGIELIDCARANSNAGIELAAERCGYGQDLNAFESQLQQDCDRMGISISSFQDLITMEQKINPPGIEIAPDSKAQL